MSKSRRTKNPLARRAKRGFRGYPIGTVAWYGPDDQTATKAAVGIIVREDEEPVELRRWVADRGDIRSDLQIANEIRAFLREYSVRSVVMPDRIIGCPHEEGVDYAEGTVCPACPFWATRDRWTGDSFN
jgi:hypothetical protein